MKTYQFKIDQQDFQVDIHQIEDDLAKVSVNGELYEVELRGDKVAQIQNSTEPVIDSISAQTPTAPNAKSAAAGAIKSPLPGKVLDILVKPGDTVRVGQTIICLEAMKMENNINSDKAGVVTQIQVHKGDTVLEGDTLIEIG